MSDTEKIDWKSNGVRIIPGDSLDENTPQTPGMTRAAAINYARVGAQKIWTRARAAPFAWPVQREVTGLMELPMVFKHTLPSLVVSSEDHALERSAKGAAAIAEHLSRGRFQPSPEPRAEPFLLKRVVEFHLPYAKRESSGHDVGFPGRARLRLRS